MRRGSASAGRDDPALTTAAGNGRHPVIPVSRAPGVGWTLIRCRNGPGRHPVSSSNSRAAASAGVSCSSILPIGISQPQVLYNYYPIMYGDTYFGPGPTIRSENEIDNAHCGTMPG